MKLSPAAVDAPKGPLWAPTYRLLGYCVVVGILGGLAAIFFEWDRSTESRSVLRAKY